MQVDFQSLYEQKHLNLLEEKEVNYIIKENKLDTNLISDGYHTFAELYEHRIILFITLCRVLQSCGSFREEIWRSKKHSDGSGWEGWFILGIGDKKGAQITYHLPISKWDECSFAFDKELAPEFDGHTAADVLSRLNKL